MSQAKLSPQERARLVVDTAPKVLGQVLRVISNSRDPAGCLHRLVHWIAGEGKLAASGAALSDDELVAALRSAPASESAFVKALRAAPPSFTPVVPYTTLADMGLSDAGSKQAEATSREEKIS